MESSFYKVYLLVIVVLRELTILTGWYVGIEKSFPPYRVFFTFYITAIYTQNLNLILLHLNRFTIIWMPFMHNRIWNTWFIIAAGLLCLCIGVAFSYENFGVNNLYEADERGYPALTLEAAKQMAVANPNMGLLSEFFPGISLAINLATVSKMIYFRIRGKKFASGFAIEIHLFLICVANLGVQLTLLVFLRCLTIVSGLTEFFAFLSSLIYDLACLSEVYIGLLLNRQLRSRFYALYLERLFSSKTPRKTIVLEFSQAAVLPKISGTKVQDAPSPVGY